MAIRSNTVPDAADPVLVRVRTAHSSASAREIGRVAPAQKCILEREFPAQVYTMTNGANRHSFNQVPSALNRCVIC